MRKIVFFTSSLNIGGIEKVFITYANTLASMGYDVSYLVCYTNGDLSSELNSNVIINNLGTNKLRKSIPYLISYLRKNNPDYIFVANNATLIILLAKILCFSKIKIIASHHNYINVDVNSFIEKKIIGYIYNRCYSVIAISEGIYSFLIKKGVNKEKIRLINNPIDLNKIIVTSRCYNIIDENYILFLGRLSKVKNIPLLILALNILRKKSYKIKLLIVGDGPELTNLKAMVREMSMDEDVIFEGIKTNPYPYILGAKIIALSSSSEAFPTVLLESLALGKTVVSTPTLGAIEILDKGNYGYITKSFNDKDEFANILETAIKEPKDPTILKLYANKYKVDIIIKEIEKIWN